MDSLLSYLVSLFWSLPFLALQYIHEKIVYPLTTGNVDSASSRQSYRASPAAGVSTFYQSPAHNLNNSTPPRIRVTIPSREGSRSLVHEFALPEPVYLTNQNPEIALSGEFPAEHEPLTGPPHGEHGLRAPEDHRFNKLHRLIYMSDEDTVSVQNETKSSSRKQYSKSKLVQKPISSSRHAVHTPAVSHSLSQSPKRHRRESGDRSDANANDNVSGKQGTHSRHSSTGSAHRKNFASTDHTEYIRPANLNSLPTNVQHHPEYQQPAYVPLPQPDHEAGTRYMQQPIPPIQADGYIREFPSQGYNPPQQIYSAMPMNGFADPVYPQPQLPAVQHQLPLPHQSQLTSPPHDSRTCQICQHEQHESHLRNRCRSRSRDRIVVVPGVGTGGVSTSPGPWYGSNVYLPYDPVALLRVQRAEDERQEYEKRAIKAKHERELQKLENEIKHLRKEKEMKGRFIYVRNMAMKKNWTIPLRKATTWSDLRQRLIEAFPATATPLLQEGCYEVRRLNDTVHILPSVWADVVKEDHEYEVILIPPHISAVSSVPISSKRPRNSRLLELNPDFKSWFAEIDKKERAKFDGRKILG